MSFIFLAEELTSGLGTKVELEEEEFAALSDGATGVLEPELDLLNSDSTNGCLRTLGEQFERIKMPAANTNVH